jgi:hypothetical protein
MSSEVAVKFNFTYEEKQVVLKIVERAAMLGFLAKDDHAVENLSISLLATHLNGCRLNLNALLVVDIVTFAHDIFGIDKNCCRETGKLLNDFLPRSAI